MLYFLSMIILLRYSILFFWPLPSLPFHKKRASGCQGHVLIAWNELKTTANSEIKPENSSF